MLVMRQFEPARELTTDLTLNAEVRRICIIEGGYPDRWPRHHSCPCCGIGELASVFSKYDFNHDQCTSCGFVCVNPYPPDDVLKRLYAGSYYSNFREYYEARAARQGRVQSISAAPLGLIEPMITGATKGRKRGDWLDVGGGIGTVAELVRRRCPDWAIALNEFNPRSAELAREIYGLEILSNNASELSRSDRKFDIISFIQVLEHITDPLSFLRSYVGLLKPDGAMVVVLPQFTRLNAAVSKAASPTATPPFHVSLFRKDNLHTLFARVGAFRAVQVDEFGPPAFNLLHHYDVSDHWDISIPTSADPIPKSLLVKNYQPETAKGLNALAEADLALTQHFSKIDGSLYLVGFARRQTDGSTEISLSTSAPSSSADTASAQTEQQPHQVRLWMNSNDNRGQFRLGSSPAAAREVRIGEGRLLVAYSNASNYVSTTAEYLDSISRWSGLDVRYVHVTHGAEIDFDLNEFDAIFQSYCARLPIDDHVSANFLEKLTNFRGIKMLAVQDEYDHFLKLKQAIKKIGYDVVFTNASASLAQRLYPPEEFLETEFITVLTGYVPEALENLASHPRALRDRPVHIGYRCRILPAYYGRLGHEKFEIGRRMREICETRSIPNDIEWSDNKRLYGGAWYGFIASCRANLGSETGSNVFDLDGSLRALYEEMSAERGAPLSYEDFCVYTDPLESQFDIGQISPRIFEAAALYTPLILFSGRYLDILSPDEHYIELKKDFSNVDTVLERLQDIDELERMADRAQKRLIRSGDFSYRRFGQLIGETIARKAEELGSPLRHAAGGLNYDELSPISPSISRVESPTRSPRHPAVFFYREFLRQHEIFYRDSAVETARLNSIITEQTDTYSAEIARINNILSDCQNNYSAEIGRLNDFIVDLRKSYSVELDRLGQVLANYQEDYTAEIQRLNDIIIDRQKGYALEVGRLNEAMDDRQRIYALEVGRLNEAMGDRQRIYALELERLNGIIDRIKQFLLMRAALKVRKFYRWLGNR